MDVVEREKRDPIEIVPYDSGWPERFNELSDRLWEVLGGIARRIDHIGSTAIPGLPSKPVIDVQISVDSLEPEEPYRHPLESLGFHFRPDDDPGHRFFFDAENHPRTAHVNVCEAGSEWERRHLLFRDYMRERPEVQEEYARLKRDLAGRHRADRAAYAAGKEAFLAGVMRAASAWAREAGWNIPR